MVKSFLVAGGVAIGYVLGARAGRERFEDIVAVARRVSGSQTVQATAGVMHAQVDDAKGRFRNLVATKVPKGTHLASVNGSATRSF